MMHNDIIIFITAISLFLCSSVIQCNKEFILDMLFKHTYTKYEDNSIKLLELPKNEQHTIVITTVRRIKLIVILIRIIAIILLLTLL